MSGAIFQSELLSLIQESKRKHPDVKAAAEKSLSDLKALSMTSEIQLVGDLLRKSSFVDPFLLACKSRNAKLVTSSAVCLQRLVASHALPTERLKEVLEAFREVTSSGFDVQIKILQTLPSLLQIYGSDIHGDLLFTSLEICGALQSSRTTVVSSTASATLQQLVSTAFERIADEDEATDSETLRDVHIGDEARTLGESALDGLEIFADLCNIADGVGAKRLKSSTMSPTLVLDLVLTIVASNEKVFQTHSELLVVCRSKLMPALLRRLSAKSPFPVTIRAMRILYLLISRHLMDLKDESETSLGLLIHFLDPEASQGWKRAACMEVLRHVISNFPLLRLIFDCFDREEDGKDIVGKMMAAFAKIAAEKPTVIGLSHQSTMSARQNDEEENGQEQASLESAGVEGVIGGTVTAESHITGISAIWSLPKTPYLEQLDKNDASSLPETYIYSLVLDCMSALSEGLAKYVMPLSVSRNEKKRAQEQSDKQAQNFSGNHVNFVEKKNTITDPPSDPQKVLRLINPMNLTSHPQSEPIKTVAALITSCWPALLATCATFLNAALDPEFYHKLIRALQKMTQVAGVLELSTPRDAFMTTLAKAAVPPQALQTSTATDDRKAEPTFESLSADDAGSTIASPVNKSAIESRMSTKADVSLLTTRNLLCVRALLNLGIALGPTLSQGAWYILLETLQEAEHLIKVSSRILRSQNDKITDDTSSNDSSTRRANLGGEVAAVEAASKKMFAITANFDNDVFVGLLKALLSLSVLTESLHDRNEVASPTGSSSFRRVGRVHQSSRSTSGPFFKAAVEDNEVLFVLDKISELARSNLQRFVRGSPTDSGWVLITAGLLQVIRSSTTVADTRLRAGNLLNSIVLGTLQALNEEEEYLQREVQYRGVLVLTNQIDELYQQSAFSTSESRNCDHEIHENAISTLISIVEEHGENLLISWEMIFKLGGSIFEEQAQPLRSDTHQHVPIRDVRARSVKLISTAFRLLQLIGSDFLNLLPLRHLLDFIDILLLFGRQHDDLNVSLTSTTFFWNLADFLHSRQDHSTLNNLPSVPVEDFLIRQISRGEDAPNVIESLWLVLLLRLTILTVDSRLEVRNGAIRVMLRILDASGVSLSPNGWHICLSLILLPLLQSHASLLVKLEQKGSDADSESFERWYPSTVALLESSINLVCHYFHTISADEHFPVFWQHLFELLESILTTSSLDVATAAFHGVSLLFSAVKKAGYHDAHAAGPALRLWMRCHPADIAIHSDMEDISTKEHGSNQEAFVAHAEILVRVTEALPSVRLDQMVAKGFMQSLRKTILLCVHPPYGSDVYKMGPEQEYVMAILQLLSQTRISTSHEYYKALFDFIEVASKDESQAHSENHPCLEISAKHGPNLRKGQRPTFVAFASRCMDVLENDVIRIVQHDTPVTNPLIIRPALATLSNTIKAKYSTKVYRGDPMLWRKAISSALAIMEAVSSHGCNVVDQERSTALNEVYESAVEVAAGILGSGGLMDLEQTPERSVIDADEQYDITAFKRLSLSLIPALTKLKDPDIATRSGSISEIQRSFVINLFRTSMITTPRDADRLSDMDLSSLPLSSFLRIRPGTVKELVFYVRSNISYLALGTLFKLTSAFGGEKLHDSHLFAAHLLLAKTAAPYVLLRAAHTLKSFIADQPLRGPMPMPSKLRAEMLHMLRVCLELRSEDEAFVGMTEPHAVLGEDGRRHLRLLYPLILRTWKVWRRVPRYGFSWITDQDGVAIEKCLHQWMEICGEVWQLSDVKS